MSSMITLTNGHLQSLAGVAVPGGKLALTLSEDATQIVSPFAVVVGGITQTFTFDSSANLPANAKIYSNVELSPSTTYTAVYLDPNGARLSNPQVWYFTQAAGSTVDIGTIVPITGGGGVPPLAAPNTVYAGPPTGTTPNAGAFRKIVAADLPTSLSSIDGLIFVSTEGSDSNDGLSYGTAKATIQAAINALPASGGIVQLLAGTYAQNSSLTLKANLTIQGMGRGDTSGTPATIITTTLASGDLFPITNLAFVCLRDFAIKNTAAAGANAAIRLNYGQFCVCERLFISGNFAVGIELDSSAASLGSTIRNSFEDVFITSLAASGGIGVLLNGHDGAGVGKTINNNWFRMVAAQGGTNGGVGLKVTNTDNSQEVNENFFYGDEFATATGMTGGTGILFTNGATRGMVFIDCNVEANHVGLNKATANTVTFIGGNFSSNDTNVTDSQPGFTQFIGTNVGGTVQNFAVTPAGDVYTDGLGIGGAAPVSNGINSATGAVWNISGTTKLTINANDPKVVAASLATPNLSGIRFADQFSGSDIFAKANAAIADIGSNPGCVIIPPGTYNSVTTTLTCVNGISIYMPGAKVNYTGTGNAIKFQNIENAGIIGPAWIKGPGTGGSTVGLLFGIGSAGNGTVTTYNLIQAVNFDTFNIGVKVDGSTSNNGTYTNTFSAVVASNCNIGWSIIPTNANTANANTFEGCIAIGSVSDGWKIDGAQGNGFISCRAESNGGFGWNFPGTQATANNSVLHSWNEANTSGDFNSGSSSNITGISVIGGVALSSPVFNGSWKGAGNILKIPASRSDEYVSSSTLGWHINSGIGAAFGMAWINDEGAPSFTNVLGISRTGSGSGAGVGNLYAGSTEYPLTVRSQLVIPEIAAPSGLALNEILWADSTAHRLQVKNNNGSQLQLVQSGVDINTSDQVTATHITGFTNNTITKFNSTGNVVNATPTDNGTTFAVGELLTATGIGLNGAGASANVINGTSGMALQVSGSTIASVNSSSLQVSQPILGTRLRTNQGTAYSAADGAIVLSSGWGTTRTVSAGTGFDQALSFTANSSGTGQAANPTITITFKDGTWTTAPIVTVLRNDLITPFNTPPHTISVTATVLTITFNGTPTAGNSYSYIVHCIGV